MGEVEPVNCPRKRWELLSRAMVANGGGVSGSEFAGSVAAAAVPIEAVSDNPGCDGQPICDGPLTQARHQLSPLRIFGDTFQVCPVETNVAMPIAHPET